MSTFNIPGVAPTKVIEKTWNGIPGAILCFPVMIALSNSIAKERESTLLLTAQERQDHLLDYRIRTISDILDAPPTMIMEAKLEAALRAKHEAAIQGLTLKPENQAYQAKVDRIHENLRLTVAEVDALREPLPNFPDSTGDTLATVAYDYFSQTDDKGRRIFQLLVEDVIDEFWIWATPRPTFSVSAYTQSK